jgi:cardiolipin synthase
VLRSAVEPQPPVLDDGSAPAPPAPPARTPFAEMTVGAHRLALLRDGVQAFPAMLDAIASARATICLETYILRDDRTGRRFADALSERARAGVEVSLLYDAWGSSLGGAYVDGLEAAGVRVLAYHPIRFSGRRREALGRLAHRDHRKALIVDSRIGFTGGINITDEYAPVEEGGAAWRDTHLSLDGPAARELEYFFRTTWRRAGGAPFDEGRYVGDGRRPDPLVSVISSHVRRARTNIRSAYRDAIRTARQRIWITNAYFLPALLILGDLADAARRGADVRVMVAGTTDVRAVLYASRSIYELLLRAGVRLYEWTGRVLHAKTMVVDGRWATVGSSNLDAQSLRQNLEVNAIVRHPAFAAALERMFEEDLASCEEINQERWQRRPLWVRATSWGAYMLRNWL